MIVRERSNSFVLIDQHHHASISGNLFKQLKEALQPELAWRQAIEIAILHHDCGWIPFDQAPFWNDEKSAPYSFTDFPTSPKTVLYKTGIDKVEANSTYAALLCSNHYELFLKDNKEPLAKQFIKAEKSRQENIKQLFPGFDENVFASHYKILQFFDNLSLYICLNEPGTKKEKEHPFFQNGIPLPDQFGGGILQLHWSDERHIQLSSSLFAAEVDLLVHQKTVSKNCISKNGLQKAFDAAKTEKIPVAIKG